MKGLVVLCVLLGIVSVLATPLQKSCRPGTIPGSHGISRNALRFAPGCTADQLNTLYPDCDNNLVFYQCTSLGNFREMPCGPGTVFSFQHQVCVHPENFTVSDHCTNFIPGWGLPGPPPLPSLDSNPERYGPACTANQLNTLWPDCDNSLVFYQCTSLGNFREMPCGPATVFSFQHQVCVHPENFTVSDYCTSFDLGWVIPGPAPGPQVPNPQSNPSRYGPVCSADQLNILFPDCGNSLVFYQCTSLGYFRERPCGPATVFSFQHQLCIRPESFSVSDYCRNFLPNFDNPGCFFEPILASFPALEHLIGDNSHEKDIEDNDTIHTI